MLYAALEAPLFHDFADQRFCGSTDFADQLILRIN